jgi:hypothetical protein
VDPWNTSFVSLNSKDPFAFNWKTIPAGTKSGTPIRYISYGRTRFPELLRCAVDGQQDLSSHGSGLSFKVVCPLLPCRQRSEPPLRCFRPYTVSVFLLRHATWIPAVIVGPASSMADHDRRLSLWLCLRFLVLSVLFTSLSRLAGMSQHMAGIPALQCTVLPGSTDAMTISGPDSFDDWGVQNRLVTAYNFQDGTCRAWPSVNSTVPSGYSANPDSFHSLLVAIGLHSLRSGWHGRAS